jgi:two-component system heavy metal sensor histidine kinase CusS
MVTASLFADPGPVDIPKEFRTTTNNNVWEWREQEQMFRGVTAQAVVTGQDKPLTVMLIFDVTQHMSFSRRLNDGFG